MPWSRLLVATITLWQIPSGSDATPFQPEAPLDDFFLSILSEGVPEGKEMEALQTVLGVALEGISAMGDTEYSFRRQLETNASAYVPCNEVIETITKEELIERISSLAESAAQNYRNWFPIPAAADYVPGALKLALQPFLKNDLQVWKVCGRCSDFGPGTGGCLETDYGYDALHSGLLIAPFDTERGSLFEGTLPVNVQAISADTVASESWLNKVSIIDNQSFLAAAVTSSMRMYSILPDRIGFGESRDYPTAFLIRRAEVTATLPLIWQAEKIVQEQSNCSSAVGDEFTLVGYSEGAIGATAIADGLSREGKTIIGLAVGGGPYRLSSVQLNSTFYELSFGGHPIGPFLFMTGETYSSTTPYALNYEQGQDFFREEYRDELVKILQGHHGRNFGPAIRAAFPGLRQLDYINPDFLALFEGLDDPDPCVNQVNERVDKLCAALQENDLYPLLEAATYPVHLCHSVEDKLVPFENIPDLNHDHIDLLTVKGNHGQGAIPCFTKSIIPFLFNPMNSKLYPVRQKSFFGGCAAKQEFTGQEAKSTNRNWFWSLLGWFY